MPRFCKTERFLIANVDDSQYSTYRCPVHGVFQIRKNVDDGLCPYSSCKQKGQTIENYQELKEKYKKEFNL